MVEEAAGVQATCWNWRRHHSTEGKEAAGGGGNYPVQPVKRGG